MKVFLTTFAAFILLYACAQRSVMPDPGRVSGVAPLGIHARVQPLASGDVVEIGTVESIDIYGGGANAMVLIHPGSPYNTIDVYGQHPGIVVGESVICTGKYVSSPPNQWIQNATIVPNASPAPSPTPSGQVTETGTIYSFPYPGTEVVLISPGSPYHDIDVYAPNADPNHFSVGQQVKGVGLYVNSPPNQWIQNATLTAVGPSPSPSPSVVPSPSPGAAITHIEVIIDENTPYQNIIGNSFAPYLNNTLIPAGELLTSYFAIEHPSQPNYLDLYSGSNQGTTGTDACVTPPLFSTTSLGGELIAKGFTVKGYYEDLDSAGDTICNDEELDASGNPFYAHKHNPTIQFTDTPAADSVPYTQLASDISANTVPSFALIAPNQCNDGHDTCGGNQFTNLDNWLHNNAPALISYNSSHNGQLWVIFDEGDSGNNQVVAVCVGVSCTAGKHLNTNFSQGHFSLLRYIEDNFGVTELGGSSGATKVQL